MDIGHSFLSSIIEASDDAIIGMTLDGQIASWNQAAEHIYGYSAAQIKGQPLWQLALPERHDEILQLLSTATKGERVSHFRTMHLRSDGQAIFVSLSLTPIFDSINRSLGAVLISRDISRQLQEEQQLQEAQEKYQQIFRSESDAILLMDGKTRRVVEANDAALQLYRYSQQELLELYFHDLSCEADAGKHDLARCLCGEVDHIPATAQRRKDGDTFTAEISISSILCSGRRLLVAIIRDISERQRSQQLLHSLTMAKEIQRKLLPQQTLDLPQIDLYASTRYCDEIGGDLYDYFLPRPGHNSLGFAVGDVSGHGIGAALLMAMAKGVFRSVIEQFDDDLEALFSALNRQLVQHSRDDYFMTLFYGLFNPDDRSLRWNSAGHGPVFWYRCQQDRIDELPTTSYPLGINDYAPFTPAAAVKLNPGDIILVGTDGLWEARNPQGNMFGTGRIRQIIASHADKSAEQIYQHVMNHVDQFIGSHHQEDDMTLMVVKITQ